jgi:hypothetical protein
MSRSLLDYVAGGAFTTKTVKEAKIILESMLQNHSQWHTDRAPTTTSKKVNSIEETNLSAKIDSLLAHFNRQSLDNVPLNELVANNEESVDVNFIRNYNNNGFRNKYNNNYARPPYVPNNNYANGSNSNDLENTIRSFIATQKELNKEFIARFEKVDALCERVDKLSNEVPSLKNFVQPQRNH